MHTYNMIASWERDQKALQEDEINFPSKVNNGGIDNIRWTIVGRNEVWDKSH